MSTPSPSRLSALRRKTDEQLLFVIRRELDRALPMAKAAASRESPLYVRAEKTYTRVKPLVSRVEAVSDDERADLSARVEEFEAALKRVESKAPRTGSPPRDEH